MIGSVSVADLNRLAERTASRVCRQHVDDRLEQADVRQDLLVDLLDRLASYNQQRGPWRPFVVMCFEHRCSRLVRAARGERQGRHPAVLDAPVLDQPDLTLIDTLGMHEGYGVWIGQPFDEFEQLETRLDLLRALATLPQATVLVCATLLLTGRGTGTPKYSRTTLHRRVRDLRCRLLAAGVGPRGANRWTGGY